MANSLPASKERPWHNCRLNVPELLRRQATVQSIAGGCGYTLRVLNQGQHWEFKREGALVEWWPSTGRFLVNKRGDRGAKFFTLQELRQMLTESVK